MHEVPLLPASAAPGAGMPRKKAAASTGWPSFLYLEAEEGWGGEEKYLFSVPVSR